MAAIILIVAVLSLAAGIYILFPGLFTPIFGDKFKDEIPIKKVTTSSSKEVKTGLPAEDAGYERALMLKDRDPVEIYLDKNAPVQERNAAAAILRKNGYEAGDIYGAAPVASRHDDSKESTSEENELVLDCEDVDVGIPEEYASDEGLMQLEDPGEL